MRRGASCRQGERGSPCRCCHVPGDARLGPARSLAASSGPEKLPPGAGGSGERVPAVHKQERGGTTGNQNLQCLVAVTAAVPSSGCVYKGKRYMCFVFLFTEALITCPSRAVSLCCSIAPDRANDFVLTRVL